MDFFFIGSIEMVIMQAQSGWVRLANSSIL